MKRNIDLVDEDHESDDEENESPSDESEDEEQRVKDVFSHLSQTVSELLCSMAASKDILFGTSRGQLLRNKRTIPITKIAELLEYLIIGKLTLHEISPNR